MLKRRSISRGIFTLATKETKRYSKTNTVLGGKATQPILGKDEPLWMKFFKPTFEFEIDLDRSLANIEEGEVDYFAQSFITLHNKDFMLYQLIRSLKIIDFFRINAKLLMEIRSRIIKRDWFMEPVDFDIIIQKQQDFFKFDPLLREFLLYKIGEQFASMPLSNKLKTMAWQLKTNRLSQTCLLEFHALLKQLDSQKPDEKQGVPENWSKLELLMDGLDIKTQFSALFVFNNLAILATQSEVKDLQLRLLNQQIDRVDASDADRQTDDQQRSCFPEHLGQRVQRGVLQEPVYSDASREEKAAGHLEVFVAGV